MSTARKARHLELDGVSRCYSATVAGCTVGRHVLPVVSLRLRRGEWVAVRGGGPGPLTLLRCAAGLVPPDTGRVRWIDDDGREVAAPRIALVHAGQASYACWTVRDILWAATSPLTAFARAERRVELALRRCGLEAVADRLTAELHALDQWRVGVAAAVAGGAGWLFLELPPLGELPSLASGAGGRPSASLASLRRMGRSLAALGIGAVVVSAGVVPLALHRRLTLAGITVKGEGSADPIGALARVAEPGERAWERPGTGVASPSWQI